MPVFLSIGIWFALEIQDKAFIRAFLDDCASDAIVCANDLTAARLMHGLLEAGVRIPEDIHMVGIDDVKYASMLPVPLTTITRIAATSDPSPFGDARQIERPGLPTRDILLQATLVVRNPAAHCSQR